jgi:hypothetical protein
MNAVKVDSAKRIRLTVLTPGDYYEPEVRGGDAEEITLRRMPPPRRRFTRLEALRAIEKKRCGSPRPVSVLTFDPNIQHPTSNIQHPTSNIQHPTSNIQHPTSNIQHPTSNAEP